MTDHYFELCGMIKFLIYCPALWPVVACMEFSRTNLIKILSFLKYQLYLYRLDIGVHKRDFAIICKIINSRDR